MRFLVTEFPVWRLALAFLSLSPLSGVKLIVPVLCVPPGDSENNCCLRLPCGLMFTSDNVNITLPDSNIFCARLPGGLIYASDDVKFPLAIGNLH